MKRSVTLTLAATAILLSTSAMAASADYFLKIEGVDGESAVEVPVDGWSFGACNSGACSRIVSPRDPASGQATGKRSKGDVKVTASQNTQALRNGAGMGTGKVSMSDLSVMRATGDLDGDGLADLAYAGSLPEISSLTLSVDKGSPVLARFCTGKHFEKVTLRSSDGDSFEITGAIATCSDGTPGRISTNATTPKQTQGATFGERCQAGVACTATITFTGGQLKHTKTGHVTLLK